MILGWNKMDINKILHTGKLIEITQKYENIGAKFNSVVNIPSLNGIFSIYTPFYEGKPVILRDNEIVTLHVTDNVAKKPLTFTFDCRTIEKFKENEMSFVRMQIISEPKEVQRRNFFRLSLVETLTLNLFDREISVLTRDISANGLRGIINERIPRGSIIKFILPLENEKVEIEAKVVECDKIASSILKHDIRLNFINIKPTTETKLMNYIFLKQAEMVRKTSGNSSVLDKYFSHLDSYKMPDDKVYKFLQSVSLLTVITAIMTLFSFIAALPESNYGIMRFHGYVTGTRWEMNYLLLTLVSSYGGLVLSLINYVLVRYYSGSQTVSGFKTYNMYSLFYHFILILMGMYLVVTY
jgi:c-di-GMP-binding flagellar brake protein YcgR